MSAIFKFMGESVSKTQKNQNKILYVQYYKVITEELSETRNALKIFKEENKSAL